MNKKQIDRLLRLVDFLRELPSSNFDMNCWNRNGPVRKKPACGTTACTAGWSTLFFPELKLDRKSFRGNITLKNGSKDGTRAVAAAWGAEWRDTYDMCNDRRSKIKTPKQAANALAKFIRRHARDSGYEIVDA